MRGPARLLLGCLTALTLVLHVVQITIYSPESHMHTGFTSAGMHATGAATAAMASRSAPVHSPPPPPPPAGTSTAARVRLDASDANRARSDSSRLMIVSATQPSSCTTRNGDHVLLLSLKNKWQYASVHGHRIWLSTELLSPWDLSGQWNKVALLATLMESGTEAGAGAEWLLWVDDDILFSDMEFAFPLAEYEANEQWLVLWGDEVMTYVDGNTEGVNTGTMLMRVNDWSRELLAAMAAVASSALRPTLTNHDQGGLVHLLHTQPEKWRKHTRLERDFTMNGHWPDYVGRFELGMSKLASPVWGSDKLPVIVHYSGCQMCRGHSYNGTWTDAGVGECMSAFTENFVFADDAALKRLGLRHTRIGMMAVRPAEGSPLHARHERLTKCMPKFLVGGTQKGGTSTLHYILRSGWHPQISINFGEKEIHHFSFDDNHAQGPARYQSLWDGEGAVLGDCPGKEAEVRGEVSASYLDYPRAAERAFALLPFAKIIFMLREPASRLVSSFNMRWQVEVCGKLTWTRRDCFVGITSRESIKEHAVGPFQQALALKVWGRCHTQDGKGLDKYCLSQDFVGKLANRTRKEQREIDTCLLQQGRANTPFVSLAQCLGILILSQRKLYKKMEDNAYIFRSMYVEHVSTWLSYFPSEQILLMPSEAFFDPAKIEQQMRRFAHFLGLNVAEAKSQLLFTASPASTSGAPHENGREYIAQAPPQMLAELRAWLCRHNLRLGQLLVAKGVGQADEVANWLPWTQSAQSMSGCTNTNSNTS